MLNLPWCGFYTFKEDSLFWVLSAHLSGCPDLQQFLACIFLTLHQLMNTIKEYFSVSYSPFGSQKDNWYRHIVSCFSRNLFCPFPTQLLRVSLREPLKVYVRYELHITYSDWIEQRQIISVITYLQTRHQHICTYKVPRYNSSSFLNHSENHSASNKD